MAVIRNSTDLNDPVNLVATIAFFCCISCVILMLRFKFRATLNISSQDLNNADVPTGSSSGGYRPQREEYFGISNPPDTRVVITPSMVKLPTYSNNDQALRPAKSTNDLNRTDFKPVTSSKSTPDISLNPRGNNNISNNVNNGLPEKSAKELKKEEKERKKLEKQQIAEQKARRKAERDHAKQEAKKKQDRAKLAAKKAQHRAKIEAKKTQDNAKIEAKNAKTTEKIEAKNAKPQAKTSAMEDQRKAPPVSLPAGGSGPGPAPIASNRVVSTISLESDINRSSGPPPYSTLPNSSKNEKDHTGNTSFSKPIDSSSSWDMISQHRQQINRPTANVKGAANRKQVVMDLQYRRDNDDDPDNSEA